MGHPGKPTIKSSHQYFLAGPIMQNDFRKIIIYSGIALGFLGLGLIAYLGYFNRYFADDWCYAADFKTLGLLGTLEGYAFRVSYASNRFSLTLFSGLMHPFSITGVQMMTGLGVFLWLVGIYLSLANLDSYVSAFSFRAVRLLVSVLFLYYVLYLAPHPYQNLHWRAGFMPYTAPLIFWTFLTAIFTRQLKTRQVRAGQFPLIFLFAFFGAGFSEAANAFFVASILLVLGVSLYGKRRGGLWGQLLLPGAAIGAAGAGLALVVLVMSPAIPLRLVSYRAPTEFLALPFLVASLGVDFFEYFVKSFPIPTFVLLAAGGGMAYLFVKEHNGIRLSTSLKHMAILIGCAYLLIAASQAPSAYIEHGPPEARGLFPARFILIGTLLSVGWTAGAYLKSAFHRNYAVAIAVLTVGIFYAYTARSILIVSDRVEIYSQRAEIWDERDAKIIADRDRGITVVEVAGIDSLPVGGMRDFKSEPGDWINECAAVYYEVDAILVAGPE
jgi:hypothetical protein